MIITEQFSNELTGRVDAVTLSLTTIVEPKSDRSNIQIAVVGTENSCKSPRQRGPTPSSSLTALGTEFGEQHSNFA